MKLAFNKLHKRLYITYTIFVFIQLIILLSCHKKST